MDDVVSFNSTALKNGQIYFITPNVYMIYQTLYNLNTELLLNFVNFFYKNIFY